MDMAKRLMLVFSILILACGCSGGGSNSGNTTTTVEGKALAGAPIAGYAYLKDAHGTIKGPVTIANDGSFSFDATGLTPPFFLMAEGVIGEVEYSLFSIAYAGGRTNINPLTDLAISGSAGKKASKLYENNTSISQQAVEEAIDRIKEMLKPLLEVLNAEGIDPLNGEISADNTKLDAVFDVVKIEVSDDGSFKVTDPAGDTLIETDSLQNAPQIENAVPRRFVWI